MGVTVGVLSDSPPDGGGVFCSPSSPFVPPLSFPSPADGVLVSCEEVAGVGVSASCTGIGVSVAGSDVGSRVGSLGVGVSVF